MKVSDLIEAAAKARGSALELAREMRKAPARLSEWKKGRAKPDASEIAYMAHVAGLPVLITVAMIESELHPETRALWEAALGELEGGPRPPRECQNRGL